MVRHYVYVYVRESMRGLVHMIAKLALKPWSFYGSGGVRLVLPDCGAAFWLAEQKHMFFGKPRQKIYKQGACRQTGEAYGDNLGNWAVTRHRGITVPKKPRLGELRQLIGRDIFTNDSGLSGPGLSQAAGHPESRGKSTANPTSSGFFKWDVGKGVTYLRPKYTHQPTS